MGKKGFTLISKACDREKAFTLIELLVTIAIIGVLVSISVFGLQGARESARDSRRKADLETIRGALELYRSDCNGYPTSLDFGGQLVGNDTAGCAATNIYLDEIPDDPQEPATRYEYEPVGAGPSYVSYKLCAALETDASGTATCTSSCGTTCNYELNDP